MHARREGKQTQMKEGQPVAEIQLFWVDPAELVPTELTQHENMSSFPADDTSTLPPIFLVKIAVEMNVQGKEGERSLYVDRLAILNGHHRAEEAHKRGVPLPAMVVHEGDCVNWQGKEMVITQRMLEEALADAAHFNSEYRTYKEIDELRRTAGTEHA